MQQEPEEIQESEEEPEAAEPEDAAALQQALDEEKQKSAEYLASWQRAQADFINYKRRIEQERQEFSRTANAGVILSLLPVLDDLERAIGAMPPAKAGKQAWAEGIRLVARNFRTVMEAQGVTPIKALGEAFDPNFHEALRQGSGKEGIIIEEYQKGYLLGDRVLRPSRVAVGNGEEAAKEETENG